jgi:hypothetical protein
MPTPLSLNDLAVLTAAFQKPLEKSTLVRRALRVLVGGMFDEAVAIATVDRLVGLGALRKVQAWYEPTREGRVATGQALQDHPRALEKMSKLGSPRLVEDPGPDDQDTLTG